MKFRIIAVGEKIEKTYLNGIKEYAKRLTRYCKIELVHCKNEEVLQKKLPQKSFKIKITADGNTVSSEQFTDKINHLGIIGRSDVCIIIGEANTLFDENISVSTFDMCVSILTLIVYEQIYRSYRILNNEPYHK